MSDRQVYIIDEVVTRPGRAQEFIDRYLAEYAPGARERGMTLRDILVSPPVWFVDQSNSVTIRWSVPGPRAWWEMTWKARPDAGIGQWWSEVSAMLVERCRRVAAEADHVEGFCDV